MEDSSPPSSGRASVDSALYNATQLEGELSVARRQVDALQWSRGLHANQLKETQALCKQHERNLTRIVRVLRAVHEVLPKALEAHRAKLRALHPEEEEELLHHFLQKGNVVETFIEIITHGEGMVRVTTDRDEFFFAPMRSGQKKRFNLHCPDKLWRADHPWVRLHIGALR
ncbi:unnamed protein product [Cylicocyclus nassatus]|uniref:Uncharacterized protein n=1 Tax=Cylicocyclus nassatus TaxID=53992 RepID=A0AA36DPT4_CYLNA|nr:unnamed protein product [Cylicocyclus nassatus]